METLLQTPFFPTLHYSMGLNPLNSTLQCCRCFFCLILSRPLLSQLLMREIDLASQASSPLPPRCCLFLSEKIRKDSQPALRGWLGKEGKQKTCFLLGFCFLTYARRVRVIQVLVLVRCSSCSTRPLRHLTHHRTLTTPHLTK